MGPFDQHVLIRKVEGGLFRVEEDLVIMDEVFGPFTVPQGFLSDLDSVPRWLPLSHALVKGASLTSAVAHDWLYQEGRIAGNAITRKDADEVYLRAMVDEGVNWFQRFLIFRGVRLGGMFAWNRHRANDEQEPDFV